MSSAEITVLPGRNFSGRTESLLSLAGYGDRQTNEAKSQYIGPDVSNFLSGLASTVREELLVHGTDLDRDEFSSSLSDLVCLNRLHDRNPFTLSGGEQTILALVSALARKPAQILIDCTLEQLDPDTRISVLKLLVQAPKLRSIMLADNRLGEFRSVLPSAASYEPATSTRRSRPTLSASSYRPWSVTPVQIRLDGVSFAYDRSAPVIKDRCLTLEPGTIHLLVGPNGAGKTTLCRLLAGLYPVAGGSVHLNGVRTELHRRPAMTCAYHFQNPDLQLFETTVDQELRASVGSRPDPAFLAMLMASFGLVEFAQTHPMDLPFTLRKRVALVASMSMRRPWLLLDEPTLGQDEEASDQLLAILRAQAAAGSGIVIVTHSERLIRATDGAIIEIGRSHP